MMTTKNYWFCDELWREIKSYLFVPRTRGNKCDTCERRWVKQYGVLDYDLWWEGAELNFNEGVSLHSADGKSCIPCFPSHLSVGEKRTTAVVYSCEHCWVKNLTSWVGNYNGLYHFIDRHFYNVFLNRVGKNKKNEKIVNLILNGKVNDDHWLIKKHRLTATRELQLTAKQVLDVLNNDYNKTTKQHFYRRKKEMINSIENGKVSACKKFWFPLMKEVKDREYIKLFNHGKIGYLELMKRLVVN